MATITSGNWSFKEPPFLDGDVVEGGNCSQLIPDTEICSAITDLTINGGNFVNCKPQPGWVINGGNWCQKSFCSHEHPELIAKGLPECAEDCVHRDGAVKQWVEIGEKEYREEKNSLSADKAPVKVTDTKDADDVVAQKFEKQVYLYDDALVKTGSAVKRLLAAKEVK